MNEVTRDQIIGMDVSRDWLDIYCLLGGHGLRLPNTDAGHARLIDLAQSDGVLVCFEATDGQEWCPARFEHRRDRAPAIASRPDKIFRCKQGHTGQDGPD